MAFNENIREEELKNQVTDRVFFSYDCSRIIGNIDFCVGPHVKKGEQEEGQTKPHALPLGPPSFLWAEAKKGRANLTHALIQLVLTIGKARTFNRHDPPKYLAAFDAHEITLVPFGEVYPVYQINDFNWNATASDHSTEEFHKLEELLGNTLMAHRMTFEWEDGGLKTFIRQNFVYGGPTVKLAIDHHNFITVYSKWREVVMPMIAASWADEQAEGIIDADFYLADLLSKENQTILQKLKVLLQDDRYRLAVGMTKTKKLTYTDYEFKPGGKAIHQAFWNAYQRPPDAVYWDYIIERRDLLVPGDVREVKGAFFTPLPWVKLSQQYLADHLGKDWQQEYYVWDCAAGTGNLLAGLTNPQNVWASTLDQADVDVMHQLIEKNSKVADAPPQLFTNHVFQFDFLNDDFSKLPEELRRIAEDPEKRRKLVVYINPPYAEATNARTVAGTGTNRAGLSTEHLIGRLYGEELGRAKNELFAQFFIRINRELEGSILATFSKLKILQSSSFTTFRHTFAARIERLFIVPGNTFDNVKGKFPIGFSIWEPGEPLAKNHIIAQVYTLEQRADGTKSATRKGEKTFFYFNGTQRISRWIKSYTMQKQPKIGELVFRGTDFQHNNFTSIAPNDHQTSNTVFGISRTNLIPCSIYLATRLCLKATWLNDPDQFLWPKDEWQSDPEFHADCLAYTLLHEQNRISSQEGMNHWLPFREKKVGITHAYSSHFMVDFIDGRLAATNKDDCKLIDGGQKIGYASGDTPISFSAEAQALLDAGLALWRHYHTQPGAEVNASYYDIRRHFQGVSKGEDKRERMNNRSNDAEYMRLVEELREKRDALGEKIAKKVYEYGFLLG